MKVQTKLKITLSAVASTLILAVSLTAQAQRLDQTKYKIQFVQNDDSEDSIDLIKEVTQDSKQEAQLEQNLLVPSDQDLKAQGLLSTIPSGTFQSPVSPDCQPQKLESQILKNKLNTKKIAEIYQNYFNQCGKHLSRNSLKGILGLAIFSMHEYKFSQNSLIKKVLIEKENGEKTPGYLALKDDRTPRPLVILKCGVFCSANDSTANSNYMMSLFDQSPFNVLLLSNRTGLDYIKINKKLTLGGYSEGQDLVEMAYWLRNKSPIKNMISSVHLVGISLGGHAATYATYYNDQLMNQKKLAFNSVMPICAAIDLEKTMNKLYEPPIVGRVASAATRSHLKASRPYAVEFSEKLQDIPHRQELPNYIADIAAFYLDVDRSAFWNLHNFFITTPSIRTPTLFWASQDDVIVNNPVNTAHMQNHSIIQTSPNAAVLNLPYGSHCGFNSVYGIPTVTSLMKSFILSNSPEFKKELHITQNKIEVPSFPRRLLEKIVAFKLNRSMDELSIEFTIFNPQLGEQCERQNPFEAFSSCYRKEKRKLNLESVEAFKIRTPYTSADAEAITREMNQKTKLFYKGKSIIGSRNLPDAIIWESHN